MLTGPSLLMCAYKMPVVGKSTEMVVHQDAQRNKHWVRSCTDKNSTFLALKCIAYNVKQMCIFLLQHCKCAEMLKNGSHWKNLKTYLLGTGFPSTRQPVTFCNVCGDWLTWLYFLLRFHGVPMCKLQIVYLQTINILCTFMLFLHEGQDSMKRNLCMHILRTISKKLYDTREHFLLQTLTSQCLTKMRLTLMNLSWYLQVQLPAKHQ